MPRAWLAVVVAALPLFAASVEAIHAASHRYLVLGYVTDAGGEPFPRAVVRMVREKTGLPYETRTDADGFYLAVVHLHNDLLDPLLVSVGRARLRIKARFNPLDARSDRRTRVDFVADEGRE